MTTQDKPKKRRLELSLMEWFWLATFLANARRYSKLNGEPVIHAENDALYTAVKTKLNKPSR